MHCCFVSDHSMFWTVHMHRRAVPGQLDPTPRLKRRICPTRITRRETGLPQGRRRTECAAALPTLFLASSASSNLAGLLMGCGLFIFGLAALIFVIAAIPAILVGLRSCVCVHILTMQCSIHMTFIFWPNLFNPTFSLYTSSGET